MRTALFQTVCQKSKTEAIDMLVESSDEERQTYPTEVFMSGAFLAREEKGSTAVGEGIADPPCKEQCGKSTFACGYDRAGRRSDYEGRPDDEPSDVLFMIAAPDTEADVHLEVLSRLMTLLMDEDFRAKLLSAKDNRRVSHRLSSTAAKGKVSR